MKKTRLVLVFLIVSLFLSLLPNFFFEIKPVSANPDSDVWQVGETSELDTDDGYYDVKNSLWHYYSDHIYMGRQYIISLFYYHGAVRFVPVNIPNGADIESASLEFCASFDSSTVTLKIQAIDEDNTTTFSSNPTGRPLTTAYTTWSCGSWTTDTRYNSTDISASVQEVVNREGWSSGNAIGFVIKYYSGSNNVKYAYDYHNDVSKACKLQKYYKAKVASTFLSQLLLCNTFVTPSFISFSILAFPVLPIGFLTLKSFGVLCLRTPLYLRFTLKRNPRCFLRITHDSFVPKLWLLDNLSLPLTHSTKQVCAFSIQRICNVVQKSEITF